MRHNPRLRSRCVRLLSCFAALLLALLAAPLQSQTAVPDGNGHLVFRANVRTVVLDVVVTGKNGRPVEGLHKEDFLVSEDGKSQPLTSFEEHSGAQQAVVNLPDLPPNVFTNIPRIKTADAVTVLLLDTLNTPLEDQSRVQAQMLKYLTQMPSGHRLAIFALGNRLSYIQGFTDDPAALAQALTNPGRGSLPQNSPLLQTPAEGNADKETVAMMQEHAAAAAAALQHFFAEKAAAQTDLRVNMTLEALQQMANYLAGIPGRKNVIWFSGAFPLIYTPEAFDTRRDYEEQVHKTDALLAAAQVAIYPVAAEGLTSDSLYASDNQAAAVHNGYDAQQQQTKSLHDDSQSRVLNHTTIQVIADDTGGTAFFNTNGLSDAIARVVDHGSYFYTMTYTPSDLATDGKFRKIHVKLASGDGAKLAYRRGYYAQDAKAVQSAATKPAADPMHPFMGAGMPASTQIPVALRVLRGAAQPGGAEPALQTRNASQSPNDAKTRAGGNLNLQGPITRYTVTFIVAARGLHFDPTPDGGRRGGVEAALVVYDQNGKGVNWLVRSLDLTMDPSRYAQVQANGVNFNFEIDVPKDGFSLRAGVYDPATSLTGTLEIPLSSVVPVGKTTSATSR